jgi:hypothetical protein
MRGALTESRRRSSFQRMAENRFCLT